MFDPNSTHSMCRLCRCGHCKSLKPHYAEAASALKESTPPVALAKVCTWLYLQLCSQIHTVTQNNTVDIYIECTSMPRCTVPPCQKLQHLWEGAAQTYLEALPRSRAHTDHERLLSRSKAAGSHQRRCHRWMQQSKRAWQNSMRSRASPLCCGLWTASHHPTRADAQRE